MQINEPDSQAEPSPLWRLAFRAGFLGAALFAVLGMLRWLGWMQWPTQWDYQLYPSWWHAHEMIFGFAMPVVAGFLLTAVATWTGIRGTRGLRLKLLFGAWLLARLILWLAPGLLVLAWLAEMIFIIYIAWELGRRVWAVRQWRNIVFLPVLILLAGLNSASYLAADDIPRSAQLHYGAVWMITVLVVIIGGRIIPLFTGNRLGEKIPPLPAWSDWLAIGITAAVGLVAAAGPPEQVQAVLTPLCLAGVAVHAVRLWRWRGWKTLAIPLLWSMHLSYLCIPLAMLALAAAGSDAAAVKNIMHLLAVGTIGGMILAMMSRVSLGHTGRPLEIPWYIALAFALVFLAAVARAGLPMLGSGFVMASWKLSATLWTGAFVLFLWHYLPILTRPRVDGKPG